MKSFKDYLREDGMGSGAVGSSGPTNTVGAVAGTGDSRLSPDQREPGISKKRKTPVIMKFKRNPPKM
jgi:hypothetical protein